MAALRELPEDILPADARPEKVQVERTRDRAHGDFACNVAMALAKATRRKPRDIAEQLIAALPADFSIARTEIAGPGFINFFLAPAAYHATLQNVLAEKEHYGRSQIGEGLRINVEFVSANPTGPLHVGHGRGASYGATVSNLLAATGYAVHREYYVNDAGRQMNILAASVWLRYLELCGIEIKFPANGYRGDYVFDIARTLHSEHTAKFERPIDEIVVNLPDDEPQGDKEKYIDALVARAKELLGGDYDIVFAAGLNTIVADIRQDLEEFGVTFDTWFSERSLTDNGDVQKAIESLKASGDVYKKSGALWFAAEKYGDEKDRVVVRENGQATYFASDIAYVMNKRNRKFDHLLYILGADHHGYVARLRAGLQATKDDPKSIEVRLVQFAILYRGGEKVQMSTRSGEFVTLRNLRAEVGRDAARYFYISRSNDQHLDFDLELAKSHSTDNPVYYIQYAHARICSVFRQLASQGRQFPDAACNRDFSVLTEPQEDALLVSLARYPEIIELAALGRAPQHLAHFLRDFANEFHTYYNAHQFIVDDTVLRDARLSLVAAVGQIIRNGLELLGVTAPESM